MPVQRYPIPQGEGAARFEQPFPRMLAVKYHGVLIGAAELKVNEYTYYLPPEIDPKERVEFETEWATTSIPFDHTFGDPKQRLVSLNIF